MIKRNMSRAEVEAAGLAGATKKERARILNSFDLMVDIKDMSIANHLSNDGYWEAWITSWMTKVIEPGWVCIDAGASFGYYTGIMSDLTGNSGRVIAFEPNRYVSILLRESIRINDWKNVALQELALGRRWGRANLNVDDALSGCASLYTPEIFGSPWSVQEVTTAPLDDLKIKPDFIKIDVEGYEPELMAGAGTTLKHHKPLITMELLPRTIDGKFIDWLFENYTVFNITESGEEQRIRRSDIYREDWWMVVLR